MLRIEVFYLLFCILLSACTSPNKHVNPTSDIDRKTDSVLALLSLEEKVGQMVQTPSFYDKDPETLREMVVKGTIGSLLNEVDPKVINELQKLAREQSHSGIPLLIGRDVVHGFHTIFPIPLGQAASWNTDLVEQAAHVAASEARSVGINWTFSPMVDVSRDSRWGRVAESFGEDTYLTSVLGIAAVKGYQGNNMASIDHLAACVKHFAAYGAVEAGRDYSTVSISEQDLRNIYLTTYEATVKAGAATVMTSFNEINGIPSSGNKMLINGVLRNEWGFTGFVVSEWSSISEMMNHGFAENEEQCAVIAAQAGIDMEMTSQSYSGNLIRLIKEKKISEEVIDQAVRNIIRVKFELGLFENPYVVFNEKPVIDQTEAYETAKQLATESIVLLQNNKNVLPLKESIKKLAVIGPMANDRYEQLGTMALDADTNISITPLMAIEKLIGKENVMYIQALTYSRDYRTDKFASIKAKVAQCDAIVVFVGEEALLSGEAHGRANIDLPGAQVQLIKALSETHKPLITVVMAGRPNAVGNIINLTDALFFAWHPGTMAGPAIADLLFARAIPSGKLPISVPKSGGQCPIYYSKKNSGRPGNFCDWTPIDKIPVRTPQTSRDNTSHYLDDGFTPQFPFGYGLSYTSFDYSNLQISAKTIASSGELNANITVSNTGNFAADEIVQLYVRDLVGSNTRPVKELKGFKKIRLEPGASTIVSFNLKASDLAYYVSFNEKIIEPGVFNLWIGPDSSSGLMASFEVK